MILDGQDQGQGRAAEGQDRPVPTVRSAGVPPNSETLALVSEEDLPVVEEILRRKPVRTLSGVAVVAVMTSPAPCPHGKCIYCPGGRGVRVPPILHRQGARGPAGRVPRLRPL